MGRLDVVPLSPDTWDALAALFEQGGDPKRCWCTFWRTPGAFWLHTTPAQSRNRLRELADGPAAPGLVALRGGDAAAVGWVGLAPRPQFERLARSRTIPRLPGEQVWSVVCFVVGRRERRTGVAGALLDAAIGYAAAHGARTLEGYPVRTDGGRLGAAAAYTGTLSMFARAGFAEVAETSSTSGGHRRVVVRRELAG